MDEFTNLLHKLLTQYTLNVGLKRYKERGTNGIKAYLKQIHNKLTLAPIKKRALAQKQISGALLAVIFLKVKCCGKVKNCMCTNS